MNKRYNITFPEKLHKELKQLAKEKAKRKKYGYGFSTLLAEIAKKELKSINQNKKK